MPPRTKNARIFANSIQPRITPEAIINNARPTTSKRGQVSKRVPSKRLDRLPPSESNMQEYLKFPTKSLQDMYSIISKYDILPCRRLDAKTLETLRISKEVDDLINQIGWKSFFENDYPTVVELTREFYTTFEFDIPENLSLDTPDVIRYRLMGQEISESITEFNLSLGSISEDDVLADWYINSKVGYGNFNGVIVWKEMSIDKNAYDPSQSSSTLLKEPEWQYLQRLLSYNYVARKSGTITCSKMELYFIWTMEKSVKLNLGYWLALQMKNVKEKKKRLIFGSVITHLAVRHSLLDIKRHSLHKAHDILALDLDCLDRMGIVEKKNGVFIFVQTSAPLPPSTLRRKLKRARNQECDVLDNLESPDQSTPSCTLSDVLQKFNQIASNVMQKVDQVAMKVEQISTDVMQKVDQMAIKVEQFAIVQTKMQSDLQAFIESIP